MLRKVTPLATYENCGTCGGAGVVFNGYEATNDRCYGCHGSGHIQLTTLARKDHRCTLCGKAIPKGEEYVNETIRPWDHPENEGCGVFKAHVACNSVWCKVGGEYDWSFPDEPEEWAEVMAEYGGEQS